MRKSLVNVFIVMLLLCAPVLAFGSVTKITIDASKTYGPVPEVFASSIWLHHLDNNDIYTLTKLFRENRPRDIRLSMSVLQISKSFEDYKKLLKKYFDGRPTKLLMGKVNKYNIRLIVDFDACPMPAWLSSRPGNMQPASGWGYSIQTCSPPKDFKLWGKVVMYTLKAFSDRGVKSLGLNVGHEQEREWVGDEKSFFKFYEYAARAAKRLDGNIKVGGPGASGWDVKRLGCSGYPAAAKKICKQEGGWSDPEGETFIKNFIDYVATNGDGTTRVPLDFINWHSFGPSTATFKTNASVIRGWLKEKGIEGIYFFPSDWSGWSWPPYPSDSIDTEELASYIPQALQVMWDSGIKWQGHDFNVYSSLEQEVIDRRNGSTFIGDWGLFTRHGAMGGGIIKPGYNAFRLVSLMAGLDNERKMLRPKMFSYDRVKALSTLDVDGSAVYVLLSNNLATGKKFLPLFAAELTDFMMESGLETEADWFHDAIKEYRKTKTVSSQGSAQKKELLRYLGKSLKCRGRENPETCEKDAARGLKYPATLKIREIVSTLINAQKPRDIRVDIKNLGLSAKATLVSYTIDNVSSNACSYNKRTEPKKTSAPCGIDGAVDKKVKAAAKVASLKGQRAAKEELVKQFGPAEAGAILRRVKECKQGGAGMKECIEKSSSEGQSKGIRASLRRSIDVRGKEYYRRIDAINNLPEISIDGSRRVEKIYVTDGHAEIKVRLKPNSVVLFILKKNTGVNAKP